MANRRTRSAERPLPEEGGEIGRLADLLERLMVRPAVQPQPQRETFKAPEYTGQGDVEFFIRQFEDVAEANGWNHGAALLHLRAKLKESAQDCGQGQTVDAIFTALRSRFGTSVREARTKLSDIRRQPRTTLHEHALEIERLVGLAYPTLPYEHRQEMCMDKFMNTLGNAYLQRHLLAVHTPDLEAAVRAGNEYLQIKNSVANVSLRAIIADEEEEAQQVSPVQAKPTQEPIQLLTQMIGTLTKELTELKQKVNQVPVTHNSMVPPLHASRFPNQPNTCWLCGSTDHWKKDCPRKFRGEVRSNNQRSGNGYSPQQ